MAAFGRADLHVRWAVTAEKAAALDLEARCGRLLEHLGLWNRGAFGPEG